jgi:acyl dehydratase
MKVLPAIPKRNPDHLLKAVSFPSQAWLYRLTGDINPLHVDPSISSIQNFDRPILHGKFDSLFQDWQVMELLLRF